MRSDPADITRVPDFSGFVQSEELRRSSPRPTRRVRFISVCVSTSFPLAIEEEIPMRRSLRILTVATPLLLLALGWGLNRGSAVVTADEDQPAATDDKAAPGTESRGSHG